MPVAGVGRGRGLLDAETAMHRHAGFTTLELLIVLVLIGFLVAMASPRFAHLFEDASGKISDRNLSELTNLVHQWQDVHPGQLPNRMQSPVFYTGPDGGAGNEDNYRIASLAEAHHPEDGAEWLSHAFVERLKPYLHTLSAEEADELHVLGIYEVTVLARDADAPGASAQRRLPVTAGMRVVMVGAGADASGRWACDADADYTFASWGDRLAGAVQPDPVGQSTAADGGIPDTYADGIGHPDLLYRIVLGVGPDCALVQGGDLAAAPRSPHALSREDHYRLDTYLLALPRLRATVERVLDAGGGSADLPKTLRVERDRDGAADRDEFVVADEDFTAVHQAGGFVVVSPEGARLSAADEGNWHVDNTPGTGTAY